MPALSMTKIFLIRHGDVAGNSGAKRTFAGARDLELTPLGLRQAEAVAQRMSGEKVDAVYASGLRRAWRTADGIAARHGLVTVRDTAWNEVNYGEWEGLSEEEILERYPREWNARVQDPFNISPPGGESYQELWARLEPAWHALVERDLGQNVVVVGHNGSLRVLLCALLQAPLANARRLAIGNCSVTRVSIGEGGNEPLANSNGQLKGPPVVVDYINNTCHLEGING